MRAVGLTLAVAVLVTAPMAVAQTEPPGAGAAQPAENATPAEPGQTVEAEAAVEAPEEAPLVCRTVATRTESRLRSARQRVCRTQSQWDAIEQQGARVNGAGAAPNSN